MTKTVKTGIACVLPVLFAYFVMGFCDVVGIATSYVKHDFDLSETVAGFIPSMVFIWFLLLSVPAAIFMNRLGRKTMVQISNVVTIIGMLIPFVDYNFFTCMVGFVFLGVGNTILQVSLNPLLSNVISEERLTSMLTVGQVVKAVSSFLGPFIAVFAANILGEWRFLFPIYAAITLLSMLWLMSARIPKEPLLEKKDGISSVFSLFKDMKMLILFLGIFFVVGVDVGTNLIAPKLLIERAGFSVQQAGFGSSVYFICRTAGAFIGAFMLARFSDVIYFRLNILAAVIAVIVLFFVSESIALMVLVGCIGFFCSSIFSIIFSEAIKEHPERANEISGLMIMGLVGGAVIPPVMGVMSDALGNQDGSIIILLLSMLYLTFCAFWLKNKAKA